MIPVVDRTKLTESVTVESADQHSGGLRVTLLRAGWSGNGRYYPATTLRAAAPLFEGVRAFANHPLPGERPERSIWDQIGVYRQVTYQEASKRIAGQLTLIGSAEKREHILAWARESIRSGQPLMGLSINAIGETQEGEAEGKRGTLVTRLVDADSCDVVTRPAAGGTFDRLAEGKRANGQAGATQALSEVAKLSRRQLVDELLLYPPPGFRYLPDPMDPSEPDPALVRLVQESREWRLQAAEALLAADAQTPGARI